MYDKYQFGWECGQRDALIYGENHAARHNFADRTDDHARGYRDGYESYLSSRPGVSQRSRKTSRASSRAR